MKNKGYVKFRGPNKVHNRKCGSGVFAFFAASFASQICHLFIMQPSFSNPRSLLHANLRDKINFLSAYSHIHWIWV